MLLSSRLSVAALGFVASAPLVLAQWTAPEWGQCGGQTWSGPTACPSGYVCTYLGPYHSQCLPITTTTTSTSTTSTTSTTSVAPLPTPPKPPHGPVV